MKEKNTGTKRTKAAKKQQRGGVLLIGKNYYMKYSLNGKQFKRVIKDKAGKPVTKKETAIKIKDSFLSQYLIRDKQELTEKMLNAIKSDDEILKIAAKEADEILNPALALNNAWNAYVINQDRPQDSSERCFHHYMGYFNKFYSWMIENKPRIKQLRGVTKETAAMYSLYLKKQCGFSPGTFNKHITLLKSLFSSSKCRC